METDAVGSHKGSQGRWKACHTLLGSRHASFFFYINKRKQKNTVILLHLQESILRFLKLSSRVNMHPGWHILIAIVTIGEPRNIFSKVLHGILCIIIYYALQKALQALGTDQKLILLISMCNGKFHHLLFKVFFVNCFNCF